MVHKWVYTSLFAPFVYGKPPKRKNILLYINKQNESRDFYPKFGGDLLFERYAAHPDTWHLSTYPDEMFTVPVHRPFGHRHIEAMTFEELIGPCLWSSRFIDTDSTGLL